MGESVGSVGGSARPGAAHGSPAPKLRGTPPAAKLYAPSLKCWPFLLSPRPVLQIASLHYFVRLSDILSFGSSCPHSAELANRGRCVGRTSSHFFSLARQHFIAVALADILNPQKLMALMIVRVTLPSVVTPDGKQQFLIIARDSPLLFGLLLVPSSKLAHFLYEHPGRI